MAKWMIIHPNMRWEDINITNQEDGDIVFRVRRTKETMTGKVIKENDFTKVKRVILEPDETKVHLVDFDEIDKYFEENMVNFRNRRGLRKEIRRYVEFSLD